MNDSPNEPPGDYTVEPTPAPHRLAYFSRMNTVIQLSEVTKRYDGGARPALDGVSLTVAAVDPPRGARAKGSFDVALIPHTAHGTTLGTLREGDAVNVEVDIIAKYVERSLEWRERGPSHAGPSELQQKRSE